MTIAPPSFVTNPVTPATPSKCDGNITLLDAFIRIQRELNAHKAGRPVLVNGYTLSIADVVAAARYSTPVTLESSFTARSRVEDAQRVIEGKLATGCSVYGVSTGFGGSADTRTEHSLVLGKALLQHQAAGVLPFSSKPSTVLPLSDPIASTSMPESWVRAAILIRMNSLIRGHSGVRWEFISALGELLRENIIPVVPLRGSISASGDLSPLSYVAGALIGNPAIRVFDGPAAFGPRRIVPAVKAFRDHGLKHVVFEAKEHLGLSEWDCVLGWFGYVGTERRGARRPSRSSVHRDGHGGPPRGARWDIVLPGSFEPFIHDVARPHRGQIEVAKNVYELLEGSSFAALGGEKELSIKEDVGKLRQDRYALRTAPQFLGPQLETILSALAAVTQECNSTTDNPLIDGESGHIHHGGNFQAMAVTNPMEQTRLSLYHFGKLLFAQLTELLNPALNNGLPPSLAASDPSVNYFGKGIDIAAAAYVSELGYLANPVSTHIQSAEMHNQSVNSLALISARATITSLEVLTMLISSYLYVLCQALDLRTLQREFDRGIQTILSDELAVHFDAHLSTTSQTALYPTLLTTVRNALDSSTTEDAVPRLVSAAAACTTPLVNWFLLHPSASSGVFCGQPTADVLTSIGAFRASFAKRAANLLHTLRTEYLDGTRGPAPASPFLDGTRPMYEFVRCTLGIKMHGYENLTLFEDGFGDLVVGDNVSIIYESIRDGKMQGVVIDLFQ
ncbi:hypothetical protein BS47DRAFT_1482068 [Hydnum rufescens UP504]|uniref:Phenylalanine ammonia-lyase n=1 Tax=Hydnum rufescens UP504 TaxID=1448309 RepID=A0A9P6BAP0_9AGAM|nr:hypothetical protein BS47DRAFT_1482068 [Hydnum rufescens UP504]